MYGTQKQQLKHLTKEEYLLLKELCHLSKNMYNVALYNVRQHFFNDKTYLNYNANYHISKLNENYQLLNANSAQQIIKLVDRSFKSFFALLNKQGYDKDKVKIPKYIKDDYFTLIFAEFNLSKGVFTVPMSSYFKKTYGNIKIKVPPNLKGKRVKEVRIIPKHNARFFEIQWVYEVELSEEALNKQNVLAIDLGINNLCTCTTNNGEAFIIDGKKLKSINRYANKENARLQSIKDKQKITKTTKKQQKLWNKRNNSVSDYINKTAKYIKDYCISNNIGVIVIGYNKDMQGNSNLGKTNNQNFVNIPFGRLVSRLEEHGIISNIDIIIQEESYTSQADFLMEDAIPVYGKVEDKPKFSGKRKTRGLYKSGIGTLINADVNGSLNIMRKAHICKINLVCKEYLSPKRIIID